MIDIERLGRAVKIEGKDIGWIGQVAVAAFQRFVFDDGEWLNSETRDDYRPSERLSRVVLEGEGERRKEFRIGNRLRTAPVSLCD